MLFRSTNVGDIDDIAHFNAWLGTLPHKHKIFVPGNHDLMFEDNEPYARSMMTNATVLIDEMIEIDGVKFYGTPWTPEFFDWAFMRPDLNLTKMWDKIPDKVDVLITHGPPYGILDQNFRYQPCGSQTLYQALSRIEPRFHIFGHIHESQGVFQMNGTTFANVSCPQNWFDEIKRKPFVFEISPVHTGHEQESETKEEIGRAHV